MVHSEDELIQMVSSHGYVVIPESSYNQLKEAAESPNVDAITKHAATHKMVLVDQDEHNQLLETLARPSIEHLTEKAADLGLSLIHI